MNGIDDFTKDILQELQQENHIDSDHMANSIHFFTFGGKFECL